MSRFRTPTSEFREIDVHVVDTVTGEPVADAELTWVVGTIRPQSPPLTRAQWWRYDHDSERRAAAFGRRARTDAHGVARILVGARDEPIHARRDDRHGVLWWLPHLRPERATFRLEMHRVCDLKVLVRHADGTPAPDVPVVLRPPDGRPGHWIETGTDGVARFRRVRLDACAGLHAAVSIPGVDVAGVPVDAMAPDHEPNVLTLPPCGVVAARIVVGGTPIGACPTIELMDAHHPRRTWRWRGPDPDGWTRFPAVPLGRRFTVSGAIGALLSRSIDGPTASGDEVRVELTPAPDDFVWTGRLVTADGSPLRRRVASVTGVAAGNGLFDTDADGAFAIRLLPDSDDSNRLVRASISVNEWHRVSHTLEPLPLSRGIVHLGDLTLTPVRPFVVVRFVDRDGHPTRAVGFEFEVRDPSGNGWSELPTPTNRIVDADGSVRCDRTASATLHRLVFEATDHRPIAPVEFMPGADVVVVVDRGFELGVTLSLPHPRTEAMPRGLRASLLPEDGSTGERRDAAPQLALGGAFRVVFRGLAEGVYTLRFHVLGDPTPVHSIAGITVPVPVGGDPRLLDVDLRDVLGVATLRARSKDDSIQRSEWWPRAFAASRQTDDDADEVGLRSGVARVFVSHTIDVAVSHLGHRPAVLRAVEPGDDVEATLVRESAPLQIDAEAR